MLSHLKKHLLISTYRVVQPKSGQWKNRDGANSRCITLLFVRKNSDIEHWHKVFLKFFSFIPLSHFCDNQFYFLCRNLTKSFSFLFLYFVKFFSFIPLAPFFVNHFDLLFFSQVVSSSMFHITVFAYESNLASSWFFHRCDFILRKFKTGYC